MVRRVGKPSRNPVRAHRLRWEVFEERINREQPSVESSAGPPEVHFFTEPGGRRIGARFFTRSAGTVTNRLTEVTVREIGVGEKAALEVSTGNPALYRDFYNLCCSIADRVQINKQPLDYAVTQTLKSWAALIRSRSLMPETAQTGLLGELLFLERAAGVLGWPAAADSWFGPDSEEHDFVLPEADVEVKSTTQEQRIHRIGSLGQLSPKDSRKLYLVSVQLTRAGPGGSAVSLPDMVASVLASAGAASPTAAELIRDRIRKQGWEDEDAPRYRSYYHLRAPLMAIPVSGDFPAIVPGTLDSLGQLAVARIEHVEYSINVDGLGIAHGTKQFNRTLFGSVKKR